MAKSKVVMKAGKTPKKRVKPRDKPAGSTSRGKKNKLEQERWEAVAEGLLEILARDEFPEVESFKDLPVDDEIRLELLATADTLIRLADNLIAPAIVQGLRKYQQQQRRKK
jgi:hypothetical protein